MENLNLSSLIVLQMETIISLLEKNGIATKEEFNQEFKRLKDKHLNEKEQTKVLLHELAHAEMHNSKIMKDKAPELKAVNVLEYQAEMTAYIVSSKFELDTEDYSTRYLNNWTSKADIKPEIYKQSIEEVKEVAKNLIENVVERFNQLELTKERPEPKNELESRIEKLRAKHSQKENSGNTKQLNQERVK